MYKTKLKNHLTRKTKLLDLSQLPQLSTKLKKQNKKIVFTIGSYNLLHPGQCRYLAEAKAQGDILVVGVSTDFSEKAKGSEFPLISEEIRKELLTFLKVVDYVVSVDEKNPYDVVLLLKPDIFYTVELSWDTGIRSATDKEVTKMTKTKIIIAPVHKPYYSTTDLIEHIANIRVIQILEYYLKEKVRNFSLTPGEDLRPADFGPQTPSSKKAYDPTMSVVGIDSLSKIRKLHRNKKISFVAGGFDLFHIGHARFVEQAGLCGDILVVGIPSDDVIRYTKGIGRPIISQFSRAYTLCHLDPVDYVVIFDGGPILECLRELKPDAFYTVDESWNNGYKKSKEYKLVKSYKGQVVLGKRQAFNTSSSGIIDKLAGLKVKQIFKECMDEEKYHKILAEEPKLKK